jgi:hypothetical protein
MIRFRRAICLFCFCLTAMIIFDSCSANRPKYHKFHKKHKHYRSYDCGCTMIPDRTKNITAG